MFKALKTVGRYIILMGRVFARPERMRMFFRHMSTSWNSSA